MSKKILPEVEIRFLRPYRRVKSGISGPFCRVSKTAQQIFFKFCQKLSNTMRLNNFLSILKNINCLCTFGAKNPFKGQNLTPQGSL